MGHNKAHYTGKMETLIAKRARVRACSKWFAAISCGQRWQLDDIGSPPSKIGSFQGSGHFSNAHGRFNSLVIDRREANRLPQPARTYCAASGSKDTRIHAETLAVNSADGNCEIYPDSPSITANVPLQLRIKSTRIMRTKRGNICNAYPLPFRLICCHWKFVDAQRTA